MLAPTPLGPAGGAPRSAPAGVISPPAVPALRAPAAEALVKASLIVRVPELKPAAFQPQADGVGLHLVVPAAAHERLGGDAGGVGGDDGQCQERRREGGVLAGRHRRRRSQTLTLRPVTSTKRCPRAHRRRRCWVLGLGLRTLG